MRNVSYLFHYTFRCSWTRKGIDQVGEKGSAGFCIDIRPKLQRCILLLFVVLPALAAVINLLSILYFVYDTAARELIVTIKIKLANIILDLISLGVIAVIILYAILEKLCRAGY